MEQKTNLTFDPPTSIQDRPSIGRHRGVIEHRTNPRNGHPIQARPKSPSDTLGNFGAHRGVETCLDRTRVPGLSYNLNGRRGICCTPRRCRRRGALRRVWHTRFRRRRSIRSRTLRRPTNRRAGVTPSTGRRTRPRKISPNKRGPSSVTATSTRGTRESQR